MNYDLWTGNDSIAKLYNITSAPTIYIIDDKSLSVYSNNGFAENDVKRELQKILGG